MEDPRLASIQALAEPILDENGMELVELTCRPQGRQSCVCFLVDAVGGVNIQRCAKINRLLRDALEQAGLLQEHESLEVASPGLDRPLKTARDFERAIGEQLDLQIVGPEGKMEHLKAVVLAVQSDALVLKQEDGNHVVAFDDIKQATKALPW